MQRYNPSEIEPKWQKIWHDNGVYTTDLHSDKPKYIAMSMFNYPSGAGIHIGHAMNYTISDVRARYKRQQGYESYHPIGWDAFGLPAENYAIKAGVSPQESMAKIIPFYHSQYKAMGWSNDWTKEIATHEPEYYKWTQWIFSQMYRNKLAYQDARMQWWCEKCQTVLANEQIVDGKCWRHEGPNDAMVAKKEVKQWFFKITEYADELLQAIDALDWTESVKLAQKNWIGRSVGAEITFKISDHTDEVTVFTTRPDTLFGATFLVLAPEHKLVDMLASPEQLHEVEGYVSKAQKKSELERQEAKEKTGVFTGSYAINPVNDQKIPIWIADYVLTGYGTGAIMAVPAHDQRDKEFAQKYTLPIIEVIEPETGTPQNNPEFRSSIVAIVRNPKDGTLLSLNWGKMGGNLFIGGGRDEKENIIACAQREITEETGYKNIKFVGQTSRIHHNYFAHSKGVARRIEAYGLLFDLVDDAKDDAALEDDEKGKFKVEWLSNAEAEHKVTDELHATVYNMLIKGECYHGEGVMVNSGTYNGAASSDVRERIVADLALKNLAQEKVNYRMRDWSVSRQRYWGAPIPIINCDTCGPVLVADEDLPVTLPVLSDFKPSGNGKSALARATEWLKVHCPSCGEMAERETDTLDTYIDSSWYMFRYFDPHNSKKIFDSEIVNKWAPIDFYNGADHATAHLLYARFITRFMNKIGLVSNPEPFKQMLFNGKVTAADGSAFSKTLGNGIDPLEIINSGYGADALRTYLMFAAPLEFNARWNPQGVPGTHRFLARLWNLVQEYLAAPGGQLDENTRSALLRSTNRMVKTVTDDLENSRYNTAIAAMMGNLNELYKLKAKSLVKDDTWQQALEYMVMCVAPFAPHTAEELWHQLGHETSVHVDAWPTWDVAYLSDETLKIAIQVNGKLRGEVEVSKDANEADVRAAALELDSIVNYVGDKEPTRVIYVPGKLINIVV